MNFLDACEKIYDRNPVVCEDTTQLCEEWRKMRGRTTARHKDCKQTIRDIAEHSGVPFGTVAKSESDPAGVSLATITRIANAHGKRVAIVFYDEVAP